MKLATIGVYCIVHLDIPALISEDIDLNKLTQSDVHELINQNKIKLPSGRIEKLFDKCNVIKDTINILVDAENCNSFRLNKINYIAFEHHNKFWINKTK